MNPANYLFRLQKLDIKISQILRDLGEVEQKLKDDQLLILAKSQHSEAMQNLTAAQNQLTAIEQQVNQQKIKIEQSESTLYSGTVKNPKELQDIQGEISSLKRQLSKLEDQQLDAMLRIEDLEKCETIAKEHLDFVDSQAGSEKRGYVEKMDLLNKEYERLNLEFVAAKGSVPAEYFTLYTSIKSTKRGIAVSEIQEGSCSACGSPITPGEWQSARMSEEIKYCPSCGRILFAA